MLADAVNNINIESYNVYKGIRTCYLMAVFMAMVYFVIKIVCVWERGERGGERELFKSKSKHFFHT